MEQLVHNMDMEVTYQENRMRISISLGAAYSKGAIKRDELFEKADEALYITKEKGKNVIEVLRNLLENMCVLTEK